MCYFHPEFLCFLCTDCSSCLHLLSSSSSSTSFASNRGLDYDPFPFLSSILNAPEPILPIWEVKLVLNQSQHSRGSSEHKWGKETTLYEVTLTPSLAEFEEAFEKLLVLYEKAITSFVPISWDKRVSCFTIVSRFDLLLRIKEEEAQRAGIKPVDASWPDVTTLLHKYRPYVDSVIFVRNILCRTMNDIQKLSRVSIIVHILAQGAAL